MVLIYQISLLLGPRAKHHPRLKRVLDRSLVAPTALVTVLRRTSRALNLVLSLLRHLKACHHTSMVRTTESPAVTISAS
jgi:hypothetical protein